MKYIIFILFFLKIAMAASLDVRIDSKEVVVGEPFNLYFAIETESSEDPVINFDPIGVEVTKREKAGVSTRTTYINGRVTRSRELNFVYELIANKKGNIKIGNIKVEIDSQILKHEDIKLKAKETINDLSDFFAMAVPSKNKIYKGEGILVRYYLYKRIRIPNFDIEKYPKLKGFLKRFLQEPPREERVNYNGQVYIRTILYSAQLFPEKSGDLTIDSIKIKVHYPVARKNDPFGGFGLSLGMGYGQMKSKSIISQPVEIKVLPLPAKSVPPHFTGLVGKHDFKFKINKTKFLINEPVEAKLVVTGPGELENFEAPKIFTSAGLEEFEINGDLQMNQDLTATKEFNYTYLARSAFQENSKTIPLSYFDTESGQYVAVNIDFPAIEVAGTAIASSYQSKNSNKTVEVTTEDENIKVQSEIGIVSPRFDFTLIYSNWIKQLNILLTGILAMILLMLGIGLVNFNKHEEAYQKFWNDIQKNGINYSNLFQILNMLKKTPEQDIYQAIEMSSLGKKEKNYFLLLLKKCEEFQFKTGKSYAERANKSYFKQLFKAIKNENNS